MFVIQFIRDFLIAVFLTIFMKFPKLQIISVLIPQIIFLSFVLFTFPYEKKTQNWTTIIREVFYSMTLILFAILIFCEDMNEETKYKRIGWFLLITLSGVILPGLYLTIKETIFNLCLVLAFLAKCLCFVKKKKDSSNNVRNKIRELNIRGVPEQQEGRLGRVMKDRIKYVGQRRDQREEKSLEQCIQEFREFKEEYDDKIERQIGEMKVELNYRKDGSGEREVNIFKLQKPKQMRKSINFLPSSHRVGKRKENKLVKKKEEIEEDGDELK